MVPGKPVSLASPTLLPMDTIWTPKSEHQTICKNAEDAEETLTRYPVGAMDKADDQAALRPPLMTQAK